VLVVDDDSYIVGLLTQIFHEEGYLVDSAGDGQSALDRVSDGGVDVVVSDIMLPGLNGVDLAHALQGRDHPVPLLLISALPLRSDIPLGVPFLRKPFDVDQLLRVVDGLLGGPNGPPPPGGR
jgi:DNA-binding response OmpR family regulator